MKKTVFFGLLVIGLAFGFIGCDENNGGDEFISSTNDSTSNDVSTLGLIGTSVLSSNVNVVIVESPPAAKIKIISISEGSATIIVSEGSNNATINVTVSKTGSIAIGTIVKYVPSINDGKIIVINNFPGNTYNGKFGQLCVWSTPEGVEGYELDGLVAFSEVEFKNNNQTISFPLIRNVQNYPVWTGSGNYYISLAILSVAPEKSFDLNEIGDTIEKYFLYDGTSNQKYNIQNATSTISWNDFWDTSDEENDE